MTTQKGFGSLKQISLAVCIGVFSTYSSAEPAANHHGMYEAGKSEAQNMFFYEQEGQQYLYTFWGVVPIEVNDKGEFKASDSNIPMSGSFYHPQDGDYQAGRFQYGEFTSSFGRIKQESHQVNIPMLYDDFWWDSMTDANQCQYSPWPTASDIDYNQETIGSLVKLSQQADSSYANTHSLLIAKDGKLVFEKYFRGWRVELPHSIQSISKGLTSLATGVAIKQGLISSDQAKIKDLLPSYSQWLEGQKSTLTLQHFLSMGAGLDWDEWKIPYDNPNNLRSIEMASMDPVKFILDRDLYTEPGTDFRYNGGLVTVVGEIVAKQSGKKNLADFWQSSALNQICMQNAYMATQAGGVSNAAGGGYLRPRDMLKIGQFVAQDGVWQGERILPQGWVEQSTKKRLPTSDEGVSYGYYWWLSDVTVGDKTYSVTYGLGFGGQVVAVVEELDLVVARTAWHMGGPTPYIEMMRDFIIPAFVSVK